MAYWLAVCATAAAACDPLRLQWRARASAHVSKSGMSALRELCVIILYVHYITCLSVRTMAAGQNRHKLAATERDRDREKTICENVIAKKLYSGVYVVNMLCNIEFIYTVFVVIVKRIFSVASEYSYKHTHAHFNYIGCGRNGCTITMFKVRSPRARASRPRAIRSF